MNLNKTFMTYIGVFLVFLVLILFVTITHIDELAGLIGTIIGVFVVFMIFDSIFVKLFKVSEVSAVLYSFSLVLLFFIITFFTDTSPNAISILIVQLIISILFLSIFIRFAKKDEKEKTRLLNLPADSNINLSELAIISNKSEKKLKYFIAKGILSTIQSDDDEILFNKGKALTELDHTKEK